jgi:hypothetical protein
MNLGRATKLMLSYIQTDRISLTSNEKRLRSIRHVSETVD